MAFHRGGQFYADTELKKAAQAAGKALEFKWWRCVEIEDRRSETFTSDVLRPTVIPDEKAVEAYVAAMKYKPVLRTAGRVGEHNFFSSDAGRQLLEREFLIVGCRIRNMCPNLKVPHRPLGYMVLETLGFGTMIVTHRNCPNNAPLALWVGHPMGSALSAKEQLMASLAEYRRDEKSNLREYERSNAVVFLKTSEAFGGLSNMAPGFPLCVNGIAIRTSEALYQACRFPHVPTSNAAS